jgi:hypothetical protein
MLFWIVRDTRRFLGEWVSSHATIATRTAHQAATMARKHALGRIEVVGFIQNGRTHYYPRPLAI